MLDPRTYPPPDRSEHNPNPGSASLDYSAALQSATSSTGRICAAQSGGITLTESPSNGLD